MLEHCRGQKRQIAGEHEPGDVRILLLRREDAGDRSEILLAVDDLSEARAQRIIHHADRRAMPDAEIILEGDEPHAFGDVTIVPTRPGSWM